MEGSDSDYEDGDVQEYSRPDLQDHFISLLEMDTPNLIERHFVISEILTHRTGPRGIVRSQVMLEGFPRPYWILNGWISPEEITDFYTHQTVFVPTCVGTPIASICSPKPLLLSAQMNPVSCVNNNVSQTIEHVFVPVTVWTERLQPCVSNFQNVVVRHGKTKFRKVKTSKDHKSCFKPPKRPKLSETLLAVLRVRLRQFMSLTAHRFPWPLRPPDPLHRLCCLVSSYSAAPLTLSLDHSGILSYPTECVPNHRVMWLCSSLPFLFFVYVVLPFLIPRLHRFFFPPSPSSVTQAVLCM